MRQITYAMRFVGQVKPDGPDARVFRAATEAPSTTIVTIVGPNGVASSWQLNEGATATFASEVTMTGEDTFHERGTIAFGDGHMLRFSNIGEGYSIAGVEPGSIQCAGMWQVDGGEGQFAGARGLITSNSLVDADDTLIDHQFGVVFVP